MADYGAFVEIAPGVEGLLHVSEISWSQHLRSAQDFLKVNDEIECVILGIDREERKMSLGLKQLTQDPWAEIETVTLLNPSRKNSSQLHQLWFVCRARRGHRWSRAHFRFELVQEDQHPLNSATWEMKSKSSCSNSTGESRMSLGHKQLEENPWEVFESVFAVGSSTKQLW